MMNIVTNDVKKNDDYEDVFSKQFKHFCDLRDGTSKPTKLDVNLICDALSMIYVGTINNDNMIPLTLSRQSGLTQNVQLITGTVYTRDLQLVQCKVEDDWFNKDKNRYKNMSPIMERLGFLLFTKGLRYSFSFTTFSFFFILRTNSSQQILN